jgi:hypothetical protein
MRTHAIVGFIFGWAALSCAAASYGVMLSDVHEITVLAGAYTTHRRMPAVLQLECVHGHACSDYERAPWAQEIRCNSQCFFAHAKQGHPMELLVWRRKRDAEHRGIWKFPGIASIAKDGRAPTIRIMYSPDPVPSGTNCASVRNNTTCKRGMRYNSDSRAPRLSSSLSSRSCC